MFLLWIAAACAVLGLAVGRWRVLVVPLVAWGALMVFLVFNNGMYGHGWGEGGVLVSVVIGGAGLAATAAGVAVRIALRRATNSRRSVGRQATYRRTV